MKFKLYGDMSGKEYFLDEIKNYFKVIKEGYMECIKNLEGEFYNNEYYSFSKGDIVRVDKLHTGLFQIRRS